MKRVFVALLIGSGALLAFAADASAGGWSHRTRRHHFDRSHHHASSHVRIGARIGPARVIVTSRAPRRSYYYVAPSSRTIYRHCAVPTRYVTHRYASSYRSHCESGPSYRSHSYRSPSYRSHSYRSTAVRHHHGVRRSSSYHRRSYCR